MDLKSICFRSIDNGQAVVAGIRCFESFRTAPNGVIPLPQTDEKELGNHAITIIGYSLPEECFYFANSWGKEWGNNGQGKLPFSYFDSGLVLEIVGISDDPRDTSGFFRKWLRKSAGFFLNLFRKREEVLFGGAVGQLNSYEFTVHSHDHGKHFHAISKGKKIDARFSFPEIKLLNYKQSKNKVISSKEEKDIIDFFKMPENFEKLKKEFEKRG